MKKLILALAIGAVSALSFADKPLPVQYGEPAPMGDPVKITPQKSNNNTNGALSGFSVFGGFSGNNVESENSEKLNMKGFELGGAYSWGDFSVFEKYERQTESGIKYNELSSGIQYKFYQNNNVYSSVSAALGYGWGDVDTVNADIEFLTLPVGLEIGYSFTPNFDIYGGVGYKWLWDVTKDSDCSYSACWSTVGGVVGDLDGATYKAGIRYNF